MDRPPPSRRVREIVERVRPRREGQDQARGRRHSTQEDFTATRIWKTLSSQSGMQGRLSKLFFFKFQIY